MLHVGWFRSGLRFFFFSFGRKCIRFDFCLIVFFFFSSALVFGPLDYIYIYENAAKLLEDEVAEGDVAEEEIAE